MALTLHRMGLLSGIRRSIFTAITDLYLSNNETSVGTAEVFGQLFIVGGTEPATFVKDSGEAWITVGPNGAVSSTGTQTTAGTYSFTATATDANGQTFTKTFSVTVLSAPAEGGGTGDGTIVSDPNFDIAPITSDTSSGTKLSGKNNGTAAFLYDVGPPVAGARYTMRYSADWSMMTQDGRRAMVGFAMKTNNNFHLTGPRGDGQEPTTQLQSRAYGDFTVANNFTVTNDGLMDYATKDGPNWLSLFVAADGTTYDLMSSPDGVTWVTEATGVLPQPTTRMDGVLQFGPGAYFDGRDKGTFTINIEYWHVAYPAPTDITLSATTVPETATVGTAIGTITSDKPATYAIASDPDAKFRITGDTLEVNGVLDYETKTSHQVTIKATNNGGSYNETFTITVTDVAEVVTPTDIALSATTVSEGAAVGTIIAAITSDQPATYTIFADPDAKFAISGTDLVLNAAVDYETKTSHSVTIRATNSAGSYDEVFTITVLNVDEGALAHRYWRVYVHANNGDAGYTQIAEFQLRNAAGGADLTVPGGAASAASQAGTGNTAAHAIDDSASTNWATAHQSPAPTWLAYDFGSGVANTINEFAITAVGSSLTRMPKDFDLEWSDDGVLWYTAWQVAGSTGWLAGETRVFTRPTTTEARVTQAAVLAAARNEDERRLRATQATAFVAAINENERRLRATQAAALVTALNEDERRLRATQAVILVATK